MGIATNSKGNVYIFHRANETRLFEYSPQGVFTREIGHGIYGFAFAHAVRVDAEDNIWAVDEGTDMLIKFSPEGKVLMVIGRRDDPVAIAHQHAGQRPRSTAATRSTGSAARPTSACDQQGNIFVSDGYFDARVVKFDKNGRFVKAVGKRGNGNLEFNTPHSIATDFQGNVYVGDRGNAPRRGARQRSELEGQLHQRRQPVGGVRVRRPGPKNPGKQYLYSSNSWPDSAPAGRRRVHRRGLQDGARRHDRRQVREGRQGGGRIRDHPPDGLPRSERPSTPPRSTTGARRRSC